MRTFRARGDDPGAIIHVEETTKREVTPWRKPSG
jgi:hypothetical protein